MQDIRKKHLNSRSDYPISREISPRLDSSISHAGLSGTEQRRPRFAKSDDVSFYRNPMGNHNYSQEEDSDDYIPKKKGEKGRSLRKIKTIFSYLFLFGIIFAVYYTLTYVFDRATVTVTPNYKDLSLPVTPLSIGEKGVIAFQTVTTEASKSKTLPKTTTTTVDKKASGQITIYNNYAETPQRLVKFTRFESTTGKIYKIQDSLVIPGKKGDTPGEITVKVIAESEGPSYNLDSDSFTIPGFKGKDQFTKMYAKTAGAISGGASGSKAVVALTDLNAAKDEVAMKLREAIASEFAAKKWGTVLPVQDSVTLTITDNSKEVMQGEADTYNAKATGSIAAIEGSEFAKFALGGDVNKSLTYSFIPGKNMSLSLSKDTPLLASSTLSLLVSGNGRAVWMTDYIALRDKLIGKTKKEFTTIVTNDKTISSATISIFPPWKGGFPSHKNAITVKEKLPEYKL